MMVPRRGINCVNDDDGGVCMVLKSRLGANVLTMMAVLLAVPALRWIT